MKALIGVTVVVLAPAAALVMVMTGIWTGDHRWTATGAVLAALCTGLIVAAQRHDRRQQGLPTGWSWERNDE